MKIIITEDQVNLIKESTNKSVRLIEKFYHIEADGSKYFGHNRIQTFVVISPKNWNNELTPKSVTSVCNWEVVDNDPIYRFMTMPDSSTIPIMEHIGNTDELEEYLEGIHREEAERYIQRLNHRRDNPLNENVDRKRLVFTNLLGFDLTDKIKRIYSRNEIPSKFRIAPWNLDEMYGLPKYVIDINGKEYFYVDMGKYEWFVDEDGTNLTGDEVPKKLGVSDLGLKFSDIIDIFYDEKESLNEEESNKPDWLKRNGKVESLLKKLFENKEYDFSFKDKWEDLDGHIETYTFHYHIEILNAIGVGSDTIARVQVIIDDILMDGDTIYDDWVDSGYSNDIWYIDILEKYLDEEFFDVFPFSIYVNFYGHDEER